MKRNEIADKYKWKLEDMVPSDQEWKKLYDRIAASEEKVKSFEGKLSDKKVLLDCLKFNEELNELIEKLFVTLVCAEIRMRTNRNTLHTQIRRWGL